METWDLYTCERKPTGRTIVRGEVIPKGMFRLVVHVCVFNAKGELLIQKRQKDKAGWPNLWDVTVGGHVLTGETTQQAAERETREEIGIEIALQGMRPKACFSFENGFDDWFLLQRELDADALVLQEDEVQKVRWATREEIGQMIDEERFIPYHKSLIDLVFYLRDHPEAHLEDKLHLR